MRQSRNSLAVCSRHILQLFFISVCALRVYTVYGVVVPPLPDTSNSLTKRRHHNTNHFLFFRRVALAHELVNYRWKHAVSNIVQQQVPEQHSQQASAQTAAKGSNVRLFHREFVKNETNGVDSAAPDSMKAQIRLRLSNNTNVFDEDFANGARWRERGIVEFIEWLFVFILVAPGTFPAIGCMLFACGNACRRRFSVTPSSDSSNQVTAINTARAPLESISALSSASQPEGAFSIVRERPKSTEEERDRAPR